jgi:hypothetical protein
MKQTKFVLIALMLFGAHFSANAQRKKVAVVTFYCDKWIDMSGIGSDAAMLSSVATLAEDPAFDIKKVLTKFHDVFFNEYAKQFPFDLLPESEVIGNESYKTYESFWDETADKDRNKLM